MLAVRMPRFDPDNTPVTLLRWLVADGEAVREGDPLALVEADKTVLELEAAADGVVAERCVGDGATVAPYTIIGWLAEPGDAEVDP